MAFVPKDPEKIKEDRHTYYEQHKTTPQEKYVVYYVRDAIRGLVTTKAGIPLLGIKLLGIWVGRKLMKTFRFRGKRYRVMVEFLHGMCDSPKKSDPAIYLFANLNKKSGLETCIHEALHAENWDASERKVERTSAEVASFLWKLGFRKMVG